MHLAQHLIDAFNADAVNVLTPEPRESWMLTGSGLREGEGADDGVRMYLRFTHGTFGDLDVILPETQVYTDADRATQTVRSLSVVLDLDEETVRQRLQAAGVFGAGEINASRDEDREWCDECDVAIPPGIVSHEGGWHKESCSLFSDSERQVCTIYKRGITGRSGRTYSGTLASPNRTCPG